MLVAQGAEASFVPSVARGVYEIRHVDYLLCPVAAVGPAFRGDADS